MSIFNFVLGLALLVVFFGNAAAQEDFDSFDRSDRYERYERRRPRLLKPMKDPMYSAHDVQYNCWDPAEGLSNPIVTIVTIMLSHNKAQSFVNQNRLTYIRQHGYRYCELNEVVDPTRISAYAKLPIMLAQLPCSDYVIHVDGDAVFINHTLSFGPWLAHMQAKNLDLLLSADCIKESPINFGVFAMRPASWLLHLFKELYNRCACDWGRLNDWPAEQGSIYDLLVEHRDKRWFHRVGIAEFWGWNRFWAEDYNGTNMMRPNDLLVHMTGIPKFQAEGDCGSDPTCKFQEIIKYYEDGVKRGIATKMIDVSQSGNLFKPPRQCLPIHFRQLVRADYTYENQPDKRLPGSFMDWEVTRRGYVNKVTIGEIACIGWRDSRCDLKQHWNMQEGKGPWMPEYLKVLHMAPLDKHWHNRQAEEQLLKSRQGEDQQQEKELMERQRQEEENRKHEEEAKRQAEEAKRKQEEEQKQKQQQEEQRVKAEEERKRQEEEKKKQEELEKHKQLAHPPKGEATAKPTISTATGQVV